MAEGSDDLPDSGVFAWVFVVITLFGIVLFPVALAIACRGMIR